MSMMGNKEANLALPSHVCWLVVNVCICPVVLITGRHARLISKSSALLPIFLLSPEKYYHNQIILSSAHPCHPCTEISAVRECSNYSMIDYSTVIYFLFGCLASFICLNVGLGQSHFRAAPFKFDNIPSTQMFSWLSTFCCLDRY